MQLLIKSDKSWSSDSHDVAPDQSDLMRRLRTSYRHSTMGIGVYTGSYMAAPPPSCKTCPLTHSPSWLHRKATTLAISSGYPARLSGLQLEATFRTSMISEYKETTDSGNILLRRPAHQTSSLSRECTCVLLQRTYLS